MTFWFDLVGRCQYPSIKGALLGEVMIVFTITVLSTVLMLPAQS